MKKREILTFSGNEYPVNIRKIPTAITLSGKCRLNRDGKLSQPRKYIPSFTASNIFRYSTKNAALKISLVLNQSHLFQPKYLTPKPLPNYNTKKSNKC